MYIKSQKLSLYYKIFASIISISGVLMYVISFGVEQMFYYTIQSNIICALYFVFASLHIWENLEFQSGSIAFLPRFKGAIMMAITVTMVIFWSLLSNSNFEMDSISISQIPTIMQTPWPNYIVHSIVPILMIADWLLFDPKGVFKKIDPIIWLIIPYLYLIFSIILANTDHVFIGGSRYPYFFIDFDALGFSGVFSYIVSLTIFFIILGYLIITIDNILKNLHIRINKTN